MTKGAHSCSFTGADERWTCPVFSETLYQHSNSAKQAVSRICLENSNLIVCDGVPVSGEMGLI